MTAQSSLGLTLKSQLQTSLKRLRFCTFVESFRIGSNKVAAHLHIYKIKVPNTFFELTLTLLAISLRKFNIIDTIFLTTQISVNIVTSFFSCLSFKMSSSGLSPHSFVAFDVSSSLPGSSNRSSCSACNTSISDEHVRRSDLRVSQLRSLCFPTSNRTMAV